MLCGGVAACHRYGVFTVRCVEYDRVEVNTANSFLSNPNLNINLARL